MSARRAPIQVVVRRNAENKSMSAVDQHCSRMHIFVVTKGWGTQGVARHVLTTTFVRRVPGGGQDLETLWFSRASQTQKTYDMADSAEDLPGGEGGCGL